MRSKINLLLLAWGLLLIALPAAASARSLIARPADCHDHPTTCLQNMKTQIGQVRAYAQRMKPGAEVSFNPQPDPPGDPDPWFRKANQAYFGLSQALADLTQQADSIRLKNSTPERVASFKQTLGEAQDHLSKLGQPMKRAGINSTLDSLNVSINRLSQMLAQK